MSCAETEMSADFAASVTIAFECFRAAAPTPVVDDGAWAFARRELTGRN
jgi:hypothetical protein